MKHRQAATARAFTIGLTFWLSKCKFESRHGIVRGFVVPASPRPIHLFGDVCYWQNVKCRVDRAMSEFGATRKTFARTEFFSA
jgi:hypothetical protein